MNASRIVLMIALLAIPATTSASEHGAWTLSGNGGISVGDQTGPSFAWWGSLHHWVTPGAGIGIEAGRHRWEARQLNWSYYDQTSGLRDDFSSLARGGQELQNLSASLRLLGQGRTSAPCVTLTVGAYRQAVRMRQDLPSGTTNPHDGMIRPGWSVALGGAGIRGLAPGAEFRFDWANTTPGPSSYFTAVFGLHLNQRAKNPRPLSESQ